MRNSKQNILAIRHIIKEFPKGNLQGYEQFVAENVNIHCPSSWQQFHSCEVNSRSLAKEIDQAYSHAFKLKFMENELAFERSGKILVRWNCKGIHENNFFLIPASFKEFSITGQSLYSFDEEGRINEVWQSWDMLGLLQQICNIEISNLFPPGHSLKELIEKSRLLSPREKECLSLLLQGKTAEETAFLLDLSKRTVEYYFENIKNKLCSSRKKELFQIARLLELNKLL